LEDSDYTYNDIKSKLENFFFLFFEKYNIVFVYIAMVECAEGEVVDTLTDKEDELIDYCIIFANEKNLKSYSGIGASDETLLLRVTIDAFTNCLLTQKFPPV
jgi:hypothetical protein